MEHALQYGQSQQTEGGKPNIFDIHAQETTKGLLYPLMHRLINYMSLQRFPHSNVLRKAMLYFDEAFLALDTLLEIISLTLTEGSLCESYYGIRRLGKRGEKMYLFQKVITLLELTVIPYLWRKANLLLERTSIKKSFARSLPPAFAGYELSNLVIKLFYVFFDVPSPSLLTLCCGIRYGRGDGENNFKLTPLATLMLALRFIQWWQENEDQLLSAREAEIPPAPVDFPPSVQIKETAGCCPLCRGALQGPVALPSGRVYCTHCLETDKIFSEQGKCPVTLITVDRQSATVRRIFIQ